MSNEGNPFSELFATCWKDDALKARFMAEPMVVLAERGIKLPEGIDVKVVENTDNTIHITLPVPPEGHDELSNEELANAAGGFLVGMSMFQDEKRRLGFINSMAATLLAHNGTLPEGLGDQPYFGSRHANTDDGPEIDALELQRAPRG